MLAYDSSSLSVDQLLLEAAALRTKLALSDQQRVVEDVIQEQMKEMLQDSSGVMANFSEDSSMASTAADAVEHMCRAKHEAESKLEALQTDVVAPLNKKVEELQAENERLQRALNEAKLLASAAPAQPLVVEVQQLRQANELLRQQLTKAQDISRTTAETLTATTNEVMALNAISPDYIQAMEKLKGDVHDARAANDLLRVQMEELTRRHAVEDLLSHANHDSLRKAMNATVQNLHHELAEREREVLALQASLARNSEQCESQVAKLKRRSNDDNDDDDCASEEPSNQRRRLMRGDAAEDSSMRSQCIHYWLTGKRKVAELEKRVAELEGVEMTSCTSQRRVTQLEQRKTHMNRQLVAMSSEIERLREDGRRLRAQCAGLEAERDRLLTTTAMTLRPDMSEQDLRDCCQVIREAAAREAASSAAVVADPEALKRAMSRALELKTEVAQLQKQKDALLRYVRMREERVGSILDEGAVSASNRAGTVTASSPVSSAMTTLTLPEVLEYTKNCAKDVFAAIERASLSGTSPGVLSTLGLEPSLTLRGCTEGSSEITPHMHSFVACLNQVREADAQRIDAEERATVLERELLLLKGEYAESLANFNKKEMVSQQNEAALHRTNASLTRQTLFLTSQMQQLTTKFDASVQLSKHALGAFSCLLNSMRCEMSHVEGLRQMIEQERNDMVAVLQRIDPMLSEENKRTVTTVADALDRLSAYMSQTISSEGTRSEMQRTAYVAKLVMAMKEQEETTQRLKVTFSEASLQQATGIAERIARAQEQWESTWKSKFASLEEETRQKSMRQLSQTAVFQAVERVAATPPQSSSSPTASDAGSLPQSISDTLAAISSFIQSASVIAASPGNSATPSTQPHELLPSLPSMMQGGGASLGVDGDEPSPSA